ncbi:hypothetical protein G6011_03594 [Alternaria panax]|uniref:Rhodopsin domain-containing protein n=1 Tax=Alternaria panax TaxID=48097 RepID=A0AAD4IFH7_9PLEO|nr:hypothetical protein G6011_03594 [Alternaria panax]
MTSTDLTQTPALAPPLGLTTNFVNPPSLMPAVIVGTTITHLFTLILILARAYVNAYITKACRIEDYLSYIAYVGCIAYTEAIVHAETVGTVRHVWEISIATFTEESYICNIVSVCYTATREPAKTVVFWVIVGSLTANPLFYTAMFFLYVFTRWPREKIWKTSIGGKYIDLNKLNMAMRTLSVISDMEAFVVPVWAIWQPSMKLQRKIAVLAVFDVGAMTVPSSHPAAVVRGLLATDPNIWLNLPSSSSWDTFRTFPHEESPSPIVHAPEL